MMSHLGRAIVLALSMLLGSTGAVFAHALPGSTLTFSQKAGQLDLSIRFALEDLIIAEPAFKWLESLPRDQPLPENARAQLAAYFEKHLQLSADVKALSVTLKRASFKTVLHHDVGSVLMLESQLSVAVSEAQLRFPLQLSYHAVMHEVRTHRAAVYWTGEHGALVPLARFGYRTIDGKPKVHALTLP